jgi:archaellum biogenesis ATPase FlaH
MSRDKEQIAGDGALQGLQRRLGFFEQNVLPPVREGAVDALSRAYIEDLFIKFGKTAEDQNPLHWNHAVVGVDSVFAALGLADQELKERRGSGPVVSASAYEIERFRRAALGLSDIAAIPVLDEPLPGTFGRMQTHLVRAADGVTLTTTLRPEKPTQGPHYDYFNGLLPDLDPYHNLLIETVKIQNQSNDAAGHPLIDTIAAKDHYYKHKGLPIHRIVEQLEQRKPLDLRLGDIVSSDAVGYRERSVSQLATALQDFMTDPPPQLVRHRLEMPTDYPLVTITTPDGTQTHQLKVEIGHAYSDHQAPVQITLERAGVKANPHDPNAFHAALSADVTMAESVLDWLYRRAEVDASQVELEPRIDDEEFLDNLISGGFIERITPDTPALGFQDLGGQYILKTQLETLARTVIEHKKNDGPFPGHAFLRGRTGSGKTVFSRALLKTIAKEGIEVYQLNSSDRVADAVAKNPSILSTIFTMAGINNAVLYIPDLDIFIGSNSESREKVQAQLNRELETTAGHQLSWVIADSARPGAIRDSLIEAHRLGANTFMVPLENEVRPVAAQLEKIIMNTSTDFQVPLSSLEQSVKAGTLNLDEVAQDIVDAGTITPARIAAIVRSVYMSDPTNLSTITLKAGVREAAAWEQALAVQRKEQQELGWQPAIERLAERLDGLEGRFSRLSDETSNKLEGIKHNLYDQRYKGWQPEIYGIEARLGNLESLLDEHSAE